MLSLKAQHFLPRYKEQRKCSDNNSRDSPRDSYPNSKEVRKIIFLKFIFPSKYNMLEARMVEATSFWFNQRTPERRVRPEGKTGNFVFVSRNARYLWSWRGISCKWTSRCNGWCSSFQEPQSDSRRHSLWRRTNKALQSELLAIYSPVPTAEIMWQGSQHSHPFAHHVNVSQPLCLITFTWLIKFRRRMNGGLPNNSLQRPLSLEIN